MRVSQRGGWGNADAQVPPWEDPARASQGLHCLRGTREWAPGWPMGAQRGRITSSGGAAIGCRRPVGGSGARAPGTREGVAGASPGGSCGRGEGEERGGEARGECRKWGICNICGAVRGSLEECRPYSQLHAAPYSVLYLSHEGPLAWASWWGRGRGGKSRRGMRGSPSRREISSSLPKGSFNTLPPRPPPPCTHTHIVPRRHGQTHPPHSEHTSFCGTARDRSIPPTEFQGAHMVHGHPRSTHKWWGAGLHVFEPQFPPCEMG